MSGGHLPETDRDTGDALWDFAIAFYSRDGVAEACLALQNEMAVDVDILIFAVFARLRHGITLGTDDLAAADALVRDWRMEIIQPLRHLRTRLKSGPAPAPSERSEALRTRIKDAELEAERMELRALAAWLDAHPRAGPPASIPEELPRAVARHFFPDMTTTPTVEAALRRLDAAIRDAAAPSAGPLS